MVWCVEVVVALKFTVVLCFGWRSTFSFLKVFVANQTLQEPFCLEILMKFSLAGSERELGMTTWFVCF